jgi:hypothetical protein
VFHEIRGIFEQQNQRDASLWHFTVDNNISLMSDILKFMRLICTIEAEIIGSSTPKTYNKEYLPDLTEYVLSPKYTMLQASRRPMFLVSS